MNRPKNALVLGSGAARGLAHIGVLKVLEENSIPVDIVIGTSMGSLIGGAYAAGLTPAQMEEIACEIDWMRVAKLFFPRRIQRDGLLDGERIKEFIAAIVGNPNIEDLKIPFACVAADVWTGEEIVLKSGSLVNAIRASISFPFLFTPARIDGRLLVDGGVVNPVAVNVASEMGAHFTAAVVTTPALDRHSHSMNSGAVTFKGAISAAFSSSSFFKRVLDFLKMKEQEEDGLRENEQNPIVTPGLRQQTIHVGHIMENMIITLRLQTTPPDIVIRPDVDSYQFMDFTRAKEIIAAGEKAARTAINNGAWDLS